MTPVLLDHLVHHPLRHVEVAMVLRVISLHILVHILVSVPHPLLSCKGIGHASLGHLLSPSHRLQTGEVVSLDPNLKLLVCSLQLLHQVGPQPPQRVAGLLLLLLQQSLT